MAINSYSDYIGAAKQKVRIVRTASVTSIAAMWTETLQAAGNPGAGTLAGSNTANGIVPTDSRSGFPLIDAFAGGAKGYIGPAVYRGSVAGGAMLYDRLFEAGAYAFNANTTLASQPSFASRVPGGTDFKGTEIWIEAVTAFTGNLSIAVTYTNQDGTTGRTTGTVATGIAPIIGRMVNLPLQAGDSGVQKIESVIATVSTVGTFNVLVIRPLVHFDVRFANAHDKQGPDKTGMPEVWADSCIGVLSQPDSTATGSFRCEFDVVSK
jgi:hypothetical protein